MVWPGELGPQSQACSLTMWSDSNESKDRESSVSSGHLSGSSGGHKSSELPLGSWTERPPQVLGPPRQPRMSNPRLEQLRDKIRVQAQRQASCASLATSTPSSSFTHYKDPVLMPQRKTRKPCSATPLTLVDTDFSEPSVAELKAVGQVGQEPAKVDRCQASAPRGKARRMKSCSCKREKASKPVAPRGTSKDNGGSKKGGAAESPSTCPQMPAACSDEQVSAYLPSLTFFDQSVTIQTAMAILRDLRQQIQAGLELARDRHSKGGLELLPSKLQLKHLNGRLPKDTQRSSSKSPQTRAEGKHCFPERTGSCPTRQCHSASAGQESRSHPERLSSFRQRPWSAGQASSPRTWAARAWSPPLQRPRSPSERLNSFPQRPWSASAGQTSSSQRAWVAQGQDSSFQRPSSPPGRLDSFRQRAWSTSPVQASGPQRTHRAIFNNWEPPTQRSGSPPAQRPWSTCSVQKPGAPWPGRGPFLPPSETKLAWLRPSRSDPWNTVRKETEARSPPPCPKPRGFLGHPHSSESLRQFMLQKIVARRRQALEEKASAVRALELRSQRLLDVYRKQREAVQGKAADLPGKTTPLVSQTTPGIVTFVPHSSQPRDLEGSTSPGHPVRAWSKVTSGMVLGDQETPSSFCLCLNRALNQAETGDSLNDWDGVPSMAAAGSSQGPLRVQGLTTCSPCPSLCIYLDPKEAERLGISDPLHLRHKQARVQALETMANILQQRIDMLTTKLLQPDMAAAPGDLGRDHPPSSPSTKSTLLMSKAPGCTRTVVPSRGRRALQDWADKQSKLLFTPTCLLDSETVPWRSDAISKPQEFEENLESADLEKRLARHTTSLGDLSTFARSSHRVTPDPSCGSLKLEDMLVPPRVSPVESWTVRSFGQHNPDQPPPGHLAFMQQKSLSFLESLKLGQQKREQVLALLQLRVELEVWETQKALDQLLFKRRLERLMGGYSTHARPESAPGLEQLKVYGDPELAASLRPSAVTPRSQALLDGDPNGTTTSQAPKDMQESQTGKLASAEPLQKGRLDHAPSQARLYLQDNPTFQMLEQSLREEELHAQHQAALLRLREKALEEKTRTELAFLEHQRGFLSSMGNSAVLATLAERRQQALSKQEQEQREIHYLQSISQLEHRERMLLLQHQQDMALVQRAVTQLRWELQARPRLLQNSNPEDKAASKGASSASQQLGGHTQDSSCRPTQLQPGSHSPWRSPKSPQISHLPTEQQDKTAPRAAALVDCHLQSPPKLRPSWEEVTPADVGRLTLVAPSKLVENADRCVGQEPEARPHVPLLGLQDMTALDTGRAPSPTFLVDKEEGGLSAAGLRLLEGDPHTDPSPSLAEKTQAFLESQAGSVQTLRLPSFSLDSESPHSPPEASQEAEGSACGKGVDSGLECANGFMREPYKTESRRTGDQRTESCWQKLSNTTHQEAASTASREAVQPAGSPWHSFVAEDLSSESASPPRTCSMSSARSSASSVSDLSWPSLQEFQKASAILVQLSQSSLSDWEAEGVAATNPDRPKDSVGPHQDVGQGTWEKVEGTEASPLQGQSPVAGDPEPAGGHLYTGWPEPLPVNPSPRSGSELPAASNEVWDEEKQPKLGTSGHFSPAGDSTDLESCGVPSSLDSGEGKETSGTNGSLSSGSITGKSKQTCPVAASTAFLCSASSSSSDLVLSPSFPSGTPASKRPDFDKEETRSLQALVDCLGGHKDAAPSPSTDRKPISEPEVPVSLQASPGDPSGLPNSAGMNLAPRHGKNRALPVLREVPPARAGIALPEILSPVDEVLSYSSADFPSSTCRDSHLPPPPSLPTENEADASPYSYDFPSPPTDSALFPGGSLGPQGEDTSMEAEFPSLSEEDLPKALSLGAQGLGLCLEGLEGKFDGLSSGAEVEAVGGLWSEPVQWPGSSLSEQAGSAFGSTPGLLVQSLNPTRETHKAGDSVPKLLVTEEAGPPGPVQEDSGLGTGPHTDPHGMETTEAVDLVSTQLSRRILCDTMTVLSRLAQSGSALGQEPASAKQVPDTQMEADQRGPETHRCL